MPGNFSTGSPTGIRIGPLEPSHKVGRIVWGKGLKRGRLLGHVDVIKTRKKGASSDKRTEGLCV